jgi:hypothetical protein
MMTLDRYAKFLVVLSSKIGKIIRPAAQLLQSDDDRKFNLGCKNNDDHSGTGIVYSNPTRGMDVYLHLFGVCAAPCRFWH